MASQPVATFTRDGVSREAYTPGEAVALRADGWREIPPAAPARAEHHASRRHEPAAEPVAEPSDPEASE